MTEEDSETQEPEIPNGRKSGKWIRGALQVISGAVPIAGGALSLIASAWSESEQDRVNRFLEHWVRMLRDEIEEKENTLVEIMARLDMHDEKIAERIESREFQSLVRKTIREGSGARRLC